MRSESDQRKRLQEIVAEGQYGLLCIIQAPGDVLFAASPVPKLAGYEIVAAGTRYDIWKNGRLMEADQSLGDVRTWIRANTPDWLCDDSEPTPDQFGLLELWWGTFCATYPGVNVKRG
jgi:hypothetical protein